MRSKGGRPGPHPRHVEARSWHSHRTAAPRRRGLGMGVGRVLVLSLVLLSFGLEGGVQAGAASISAKRKEAAKLQGQIDQLYDRLSALDEDANQARVRLARSQADLRAATGSASQAAEELQRRRSALQERALRSYASSGGVSGGLDLGQSLDDNVRRQAYLDTARGRDLDAVDALAAARQDFDRTQQRAQQARAEARRDAAAIAAATDESTRVLARQQELLSRTKGELGQLIVEEQARIAKEEALQAQREIERQRAAARTALERRRAEAELLRIKGRRPALASSSKGGSSRSLLVDAGLGSGLPPAPGGAAAIAAAKAQLGKPYVWGAGGAASFDCSGLTAFAWRAAGKSLPHSSRAQFGATVRVPVSQLRPGDLLFYGSPIHHVTIYIGDGLMVEAPYSGAVVRTTTMFRRGFVGAGRVG